MNENKGKPKRFYEEDLYADDMVRQMNKETDDLEKARVARNNAAVVSYYHYLNS